MATTIGGGELLFVKGNYVAPRAGVKGHFSSKSANWYDARGAVSSYQLSVQSLVFT
jgi:hypothetical protein